MNKNTEIRVKTTDEYERFSFIESNRNVNRAHVKELKKSIEEVGLIPTPIIVNEKMEVLEGQHRFIACRELGLPIYYIIVPGLGMRHSVAMNANNKSWSGEDYLHYYSEESNPDYVFIKRLTEQYPLSLTTILHILSAKDSGRYMDAFRNGTFEVVGDFERNQKTVEWVASFVPYVKNVKGRKASIYFALAWIDKNIKVNDARIKKALVSMAEDEFEVSSVPGVLAAIEKRYNKGLAATKAVSFVFPYNNY